MGADAGAFVGAAAETVICIWAPKFLQKSLVSPGLEALSLM